MQCEEIRSQITRLGVPEDQTRLYLLLVARGPRSAGEAAHELGLAPAAVRARLEAMVEEGFVRAEGTDPPTFAAVDPNAFFDAVLSRWRVAAERTEAAQEALLEVLEAISGDRDPGS